MAGELGIGGYDPHFLLTLEYLLPERFPSRIELAPALNDIMPEG
jgi:hypothetical protein